MVTKKIICNAFFVAFLSFVVKARCSIGSVGTLTRLQDSVGPINNILPVRAGD
jgi:hypothetical protein